MTKITLNGMMTAGKVAWGLAQYAKAASAPAPEIKRADPMEGLARASELEKYRYSPDGFYLGKIHPDHGVNFGASLPANDDRHVFIVAGTGAGKGVTIGTQNAIRWKGGLFAIDPKGEMAELTAMRRGTKQAALGTGTSVRKFLGQKVAILDPMGQVRGAAKKYRVNYDPMTDIDMGNENIARKRIRKLAAGMVIPEDGKNSHFSESAETLIAGTIEAVKLLEDANNHTLTFVRQKILGNVQLNNEDKPAEDDQGEIETGFARLLKYLSNERLPKDGHAAEAVAVLDEVLGSDEAGSFRTTLSRNLKWMIDLDMQAHLVPSDFSLWRAAQEGWTVYLVLNPDDISDFRNWLRMNVQIALSAKMAKGTNQKGQQTLFFLDEFPVLGRFKEIEAKAGYVRDYGVKLVAVIQNIGQMEELYSKNWETFLGNAGGILAWGLNDRATEQYLSDRLGRVVVEETSYGANTGVSGLSGSVGQSASTGLRERSVRFPNEIHEQGASDTMRAFVIPAGGKGFTIERVPYMTLVRHQVYDSREHVAAWEKRHGRRESR